MKTRSAQFQEDKTVSNFLHYITMGGDQMVVGAVNPDDKMELVPFGIHNITPHNGGRTKGMWADAPR
ncbi:HNH endonuclease [Bacillus sp. JCM 19034]|uniref:HNH endonuclease n=1 Tax=Bacillus sp. JCM 19034 TaxID=1481928 RepID=UPI000783BDDA|nr:HNH endonuclease [Bacillus sp. JCM 19034]